jgi:hypothetical protein
MSAPTLQTGAVRPRAEATHDAGVRDRRGSDPLGALVVEQPAVEVVEEPFAASGVVADERDVVAPCITIGARG